MRIHFLFASLFLGCGGTVIESAPSDGGTDTIVVADTAIVPGPDAISPGDAPPPTMTGAHPPPRPTTGASGVTKWFVISSLQLGITNKTTGKPDPAAWRDYGYDLDGRTTTADDSKTSKNSCHRLPGSATKVLTDGELGRDNNFGQHFMAVVKSLKADAEEALNSAIATGDSTTLLRLDNVGADDNASVPGALYRTLPGKAPTFTEADHYMVDFASVDGMKEAVVKFPKGYMSGGVWVSGELGGDRVVLSFPGFGFGAGAGSVIDMPHGTMSFDVKTGKNGVVAGVVSASSFMKGIDRGLRDAGICPGNATYDQVFQTVVQSQDLVLAPPTFQDTSRECEALSIGIGFEAKPSGTWGGLSSAPSGPDPCAGP
jgi:hypothetical protein